VVKVRANLWQNNKKQLFCGSKWAILLNLVKFSQKSIFQVFRRFVSFSSKTKSFGD